MMFTVANAFDRYFTDRPSTVLWHYISTHYCTEEVALVRQLIAFNENAPSLNSADITTTARSLTLQARSTLHTDSLFDSLLQEYGLDNREGVQLMVLAESLLRIPDTATADSLIATIIESADWSQHNQHSSSPWVNAATWGLMLTGRFLAQSSNETTPPDKDANTNLLSRWINRVGESVVRQAIKQAMMVMGNHFVIGESMESALVNAQPQFEQGITYSFDMLGEAALTHSDVCRYLEAYKQAIELVGAYQYDSSEPFARPSVSIKLSALHPRFERSQQRRVITELADTLLSLIDHAKTHNVALTIDAEMDRLEPTLLLFEALFTNEFTKGYELLGIAIQAYSKRALPTLIWLAALAREQNKRIPIRLVKGAYWDSEIKHAQQLGLTDYPVFTTKEATDISYLTCASFLFSEAGHLHLHPQFATHNSYTVAAIMQMATHQHFEFQRLHGMGESLYRAVMQNPDFEHRVRIYAPVGPHCELLPYLVRRLLENGSNTSFVNQLADNTVDIDHLLRSPLVHLQSLNGLRNPSVPLPTSLYEGERPCAPGINANIHAQWHPFSKQIDRFMSQQWEGGTLINGQLITSESPFSVFSSSKRSHLVGVSYNANDALIETGIQSAKEAFPDWTKTPVATRANCLREFATLLTEHSAEFMVLCHLEAGKTVKNSIDEIREAIDFCYYYAQQAEHLMGEATTLKGPTGEDNQLTLEGRGVFACISPWNFPLAIFVGQVTAALVTGNTVVAKPAEQTTLIATLAVKLLHQAGVPSHALQLVAGSGSEVGAAVVKHPDIAGTVFTGSTETARNINITLALRESPLSPLIAETGGQNAMIVDSTALAQQVVNDVIRSAFDSAGQRCSALRVLYIQQEIAEKVIELLQGAMNELTVGDPALLSTDIGPVIDKAALDSLSEHITQLKEMTEPIAETPLPDSLKEAQEESLYLAPIAFKIGHINQLKKEHFGPILHVIEYKADELETVINDINQCGYGLTCSIHTRIEQKAAYIAKRLNVGNLYINRDQVGATVGVQPFGGMGYSGTGPKAGGPHYLNRFVTEKTVTTNTSAIGGDPALLSRSSR